MARVRCLPTAMGQYAETTPRSLSCRRATASDLTPVMAIGHVSTQRGSPDRE